MSQNNVEKESEAEEQRELLIEEIKAQLTQQLTTLTPEQKINRSLTNLNDKIDKFLKSKELTSSFRKTISKTNGKMEYRCGIFDINNSGEGVPNVEIAYGYATRHPKETLPNILGVIIAKARSLRQLGFAYRKRKWKQVPPRREPEIHNNYQRNKVIKWLTDYLESRNLNKGTDFLILKDGVKLLIHKGGN